MAALKSITIVGGGLAGLTLGIALRQREVPVVIFEAGSYPRHRVCGEFISGQGQMILQGLGLKPRLLAAGAREARQAMFYALRRLPFSAVLPQPAWCLSRFVLDAMLAAEFCRLGGELRVNERCRHGHAHEGVVWATGRRIQSVANGWRWVGLKVHARGVALQADLEMHLLPYGYVGLCQLQDQVNVCGLFRSRTPSELRQRLRNATLEESSFCATAGLCLSPQRAADQRECVLGDAITMIPPITGNGMSMAFESAQLAVPPLSHYSEGKLPWDATRKAVAQACDWQFQSRLRASALLHRALFHPTMLRLLFWLVRRNAGMAHALFQCSR
jgi:2-polyprenyl-6-methoxyphenol hydroxylase-like FAD-dependent oxidoreductase